MDVRLIATDVDGTLVLDDHHTITERTRAAFAAAREAGIELLAISGRQPYSMGAIVRGTVLEGVVVGSNGSVAVDLATREVLFEESLDVDAQRRFADGLLAVYPDARFVSVRHGGDVYVAEHGYVGQEDPGSDMALWLPEHRRGTLEEVLSEPSCKLVVKDPVATPEEMLAVARELAIPGCHPITSGASFLEVGRAGVSKASALQRVAETRGIDASHVVAFGDNNNDAAMLAWAGLGVAMGNATAEARAAADEVTGTNLEDGVAAVIERLLGR